MNRSSRRDYWRRIYPRYRQASAAEKRRILDEFCANCGYHRPYAIRLLHGSVPSPRSRRPRRPRGSTYGPRLISLWQGVWEAADYPWSIRRKALLPQWMPWIRRHFRWTPELERQWLRSSARSIAYRLRPYQQRARRRLTSNERGGASTDAPSREPCGSIPSPGRPLAGTSHSRDLPKSIWFPTRAARSPASSAIPSTSPLGTLPGPKPGPCWARGRKGSARPSTRCARPGPFPCGASIRTTARSSSIPTSTATARRGRCNALADDPIRRTTTLPASRRTGPLSAGCSVLCARIPPPRGRRSLIYTATTGAFSRTSSCPRSNWTRRSGSAPAGGAATNRPRLRSSASAPALALSWIATA